MSFVQVTCAKECYWQRSVCLSAIVAMTIASMATSFAAEWTACGGGGVLYSWPDIPIFNCWYYKGFERFSILILPKPIILGGSIVSFSRISMGFGLHLLILG